MLLDSERPQMAIKEPARQEDAPRASTSPATPHVEPSALMVWLAAVGSGILVATIYYAQPLIDPISQDINLSRQAAGLIGTCLQVGYGLGLAFVVPLADRYENRMLVTISLMVTAASLLLLAFAQSEITFLLPATIAGVACVGAQVLVPMIAGMASEARRGRVIGTVMSGLLGGIMLARPASSFLASFVGWRGVFVAAAGLTFVIGVILRLLLPVHRPSSSNSYLATLRSTLAVIGRYGALRRRMLYQMIMFGLFTAFWTTIPLLLADRFGFGQREIAFFALAGAGGALAAPVAGRLADRGLSRATTIAVSLGVAIILPLTMPLILAGALITFAVFTLAFDALVQANQILGQRIIFGLSNAERGRINAAYMTSIFTAGAIASALGPALYEHFGWEAMAYGGGVLALPMAAIELFRKPA
jgi:predicted MFS family arabinose efflux permease